MKNIALCHFRAGKTDEVSLELEKWRIILERLGHNVVFVAGELGSNNEGYIIPELKYKQPRNELIVKNVYYNSDDFSNCRQLEEEIKDYAGIMVRRLEHFINIFDIDIIVFSNLASLGWNLPAGLAVNKIVQKHPELEVICYNHVFYWQRKTYQEPTYQFIAELLEDNFPPPFPDVKHIVLNNLAQNELKERKGVDSAVIPNVFDFADHLWKQDEYNQDLRDNLGIEDNDLYILQATRIVPRKGIELAIDLISKLQEFFSHKIPVTLFDGRKFTAESNIVLVLPGMIEDEEYAEKLQQKARQQNVKLKFINQLVEMKRMKDNQGKIYSLGDVYVPADLILYPSLRESWGHQFLEALFAKKPLVVFEYPVFKTDIKKKGFKYISLGDSYGIGSMDLVEIDEEKMNKVAKKAIEVLTNKKKYHQMIRTNFQLGKENFSYENIEDKFKELFNN